MKIQELVRSNSFTSSGLSSRNQSTLPSPESPEKGMMPFHALPNTNSLFASIKDNFVAVRDSKNNSLQHSPVSPHKIIFPRHDKRKRKRMDDDQSSASEASTAAREMALLVSDVDSSTSISMNSVHLGKSPSSPGFKATDISPLKLKPPSSPKGSIKQYHLIKELSKKRKVILEVTEKKLSDSKSMTESKKPSPTFQQFLDSPYQCALCTHRFSTTVDLRGHVATKHRIEPISTAPLPSITQIITNNQAKPHSAPLVKSTTTQSSEVSPPIKDQAQVEKIHDCSFCKKPFARRHDMLRHQRTVHKDSIVKDGVYKDSIVKDGIYKDSIVKDGVYKDSIVKDGASPVVGPRSAPLADISPFSSAPSSNSTGFRSRLHSDEEIEIAQKLAMNNASVGGPESPSKAPKLNTIPYPCEHCSLIFARKPDLKRHINSVHEQRRYGPCNFCGTYLTRPDGLTRHVKNCKNRQIRNSF